MGACISPEVQATYVSFFSLGIHRGVVDDTLTIQVMPIWSLQPGTRFPFGADSCHLSDHHLTDSGSFYTQNDGVFYLGSLFLYDHTLGKFVTYIVD